MAAPIAIMILDAYVSVCPSSFVDLLSVNVFVVAGRKLLFSDLNTGFVMSLLDTLSVKFKSESKAGRVALAVGVVTSGVVVITSVVVEVAFSAVSLIFLQSLFSWDSRHCQSLLIPMSLQLFSLEDSGTSEQQK